MATSTVKLNGTTLMTVADTTAVAADVASGEYFYGADGVKTEGSASGGGGNIDAWIENSISGVVTTNVTEIGSWGLAYRTGITELVAPNLTTVKDHGLNNCTNLEKFPCEQITSFPWYNTAMTFQSCNKLHKGIFSNLQTISATNVMRQSGFKYVKFPVLTSMGGSTLQNISNLVCADFNAIGQITNYTFYQCANIKTVIIRNSTAATLQNTNAIQQSAIANGTGYIWVPKSLKATYQGMSNWSTYSAQFKGFDEAPAYDGNTEYSLGDMVKSGGNCYCYHNLTASTGNAPSGTGTGDYWDYVGDAT